MPVAWHPITRLRFQGHQEKIARHFKKPENAERTTQIDLGRVMAGQRRNG